MPGGWWDGVGKAIEIVSGLASGGRPAREERDADLEPRGGLLGGLETRLAGVLVSALHEAFARDAERLEAEREQAEAERRRAEAAMRLEVARQEAERQLSHLRAIIGIDVVVWLASLVVVVVHPAPGIVAKVLLGCAWAALTAGLAVAFQAYGRISVRASRLAARAGVEPEAQARTPGALDAASWLAVTGLGLAAASVIASMA